MSERNSRSPLVHKTHKKRSERSPSIDSYHMSSTEERQQKSARNGKKFVFGDDDGNRSQESEFSSSAVRVDIEDLCDLSGSQTCMNVTTHSLRKCKTHILIPYSRLLKMIGWRQFGKDAYGFGSGFGWKLCNASYVFLILLLVIYSYVYDIMSCQWKLDLKYDTKIVPTTTRRPTTYPTPTPSNATSHIQIYTINGTAIEIIPPGPFPIVDNPDGLNSSIPTCGHIVTTYIIPDLLHIAAYLLGLWYFRVRENEHLYALMEKVFLQTAGMQTKHISQNKLIAKLRAFFIMGALWVILTLCLQGLFVFSFGIERESLLSTTITGQESSIVIAWLWGLFVVDLLGVAVSNCINLAVVLNYSIQCEMLRYYINTVGTRLKERSTDLKSAMQDVLSIRESISLLNSSIARMTSLAVIRFAEMFIIGLCILILNQDDYWKIWIYRSLFPIVWAAILVFPLIQAASMNAACAKFKTVALNIKVFGYQNNVEQELDSFLLFIANTTLRSKLFHIPVKPSYLLGATIVTCFTLLLLFQTNYVGPAGRLF